MVRSNLGIRAGIDWEVPVDRADLAFGRPLDYRGEAGALRVVAALADPGGTFVDVGANWGLFTTWAALCYARVLAIEPDPVLADHLARNIARNRLRVDLMRDAIGDHSGSVTFHRNLDDDSMGSLRADFAYGHRIETVEVPMRRLADLLTERDIDEVVVKIDVEGFGAEVVGGLMPALGRVRAIVLEVVQPEVERRVPQRLIEEGRLHAYYIAGEELRHSRDGRFEYVPGEWNWLFTRSNPRALAETLNGSRFRVVP